MTARSGLVDVDKYREARRLHPLTLVHRSVLSVPAVVLLMLPVLRGGSNIYMALLYIAFITVFIFPPIILQYIRFRYWITPKEIVIRSGILNIQHRNIPIERVQDVEIQRNVLARLLGLARIQVQTAGSRAAEGVIEFVKEDEAVEIRGVVRSFQRQAEVGEETTQDESPADGSPQNVLAADIADELVEEGQTLFSMPMRRVLLSGVFRFSLFYLVVIFSGLQYFGMDVEVMVDWVMGRQSGWISRIAEMPPFIVGVATLMIVAVFSWLTGIVSNLNRYYRFHLSRDGDKLHIRSGLLTQLERTIPLEKVQAYIIRTNPLKKTFGWYSLSVQTMGFSASQQGHHSVIPFARMSNIMEVMHSVRPLDPPAVFLPSSRLHVRRVFVRLSAILILAVAGLWYVWGDALYLLALLPFVFYYAVSRYRTQGYRELPDGLYVRRGVFSEAIWVLPPEKHQAFFSSSSYFQRRLGLESVYVDTAGAPSGGAVIADLPTGEARDLLARLIVQMRYADPQDRDLIEDASTDRHPPAAQYL